MMAEDLRSLEEEIHLEYPKPCSIVVSVLFILIIGAICTVSSFVMKLLGEFITPIQIMAPGARMTGTMLAASGYFVTLNAVFMWIGVVAKKRILVRFTVACTFFLIFGSGIAGFAAFGMIRSNCEVDTTKNVTLNAFTHYQNDSTMATYINVMQTKFNCCGLASYTDWINGWREDICIDTSKHSVICFLPRSCCNEEKLGVNKENCPVKFVNGSRLRSSITGTRPRLVPWMKMFFLSRGIEMDYNFEKADDGIYESGCTNLLTDHILYTGELVLFYTLILLTLQIISFCLEVNLVGVVQESVESLPPNEPDIIQYTLDSEDLAISPPDLIPSILYLSDLNDNLDDPYYYPENMNSNPKNAEGVSILQTV